VDPTPVAQALPTWLGWLAWFELVDSGCGSESVTSSIQIFFLGRPTCPEDEQIAEPAPEVEQKL
jgi:hypothetical protein